VTETYLLVALGPERYALPADNVLEVGRLADATAVPGAPAGVVGLTNIRGQVVPLLDLGALVGVETTRSADAMVLVDDGDRQACLAVDALLDVDALDESSGQAEAGPVRASVLVDDALVGVLDVNELLGTLG
jgi:purine-binding chemotaxis protein CheW